MGTNSCTAPELVKIRKGKNKIDVFFITVIEWSVGVFAVEVVDVEIVDELTKRVIDESPNRVFVELVIEGTTVDFVVEVNDE